MLKYFKKDKGFTLIELLVVIAIIAVLASIVLVSLNTARTKGRDARRVADIKSLQVALALSFDASATNVYPATLSALVGTQIPAIPVDPKTGLGYKYSVSTAVHASGANKAYHLAAILEDSGHSSLLADADNELATTNWTSGDVAYIDGTDCTTTLTAGGTDTCYDVVN